ncbi:hypothetical protein [Pseudoalteromonas sp. S558]|uniref:hypothetical protein n=1 Tax=Pseudoalteromonas sp. S558 TaxID=2066515 RepID=UPI00110A7515|nr:hypothetical protein [Pseudoalteromonas sp. S558]TMO02894.1 hypothetical protein CWB66_12215 [Pseudoalteromonas sp. S558]
MELIEELYNKWLVIKPYTSVFSSQAIIAAAFLIALINSLRKAINQKELLSNFITIAFVCINYLLTALLMEYVLGYVQNHNSAASAQNVYLGFILSNVLTLFLMYKAHIKLSYTFTPLYFAVNRLFIVLTACHLLLWVKLVVLNLQQEYEQFHYIYSFTVLYISFSLAVIMIFPYILKTKFGRILIFSSPRGGNV